MTRIRWRNSWWAALEDGRTVVFDESTASWQAWNRDGHSYGPIMALGIWWVRSEQDGRIYTHDQDTNAWIERTSQALTLPSQLAWRWWDGTWWRASDIDGSQLKYDRSLETWQRAGLTSDEMRRTRHDERSIEVLVIDVGRTAIRVLTVVGSNGDTSTSLADPVPVAAGWDVVRDCLVVGKDVIESEVEAEDITMSHVTDLMGSQVPLLIGPTEVGPESIAGVMLHAAFKAGIGTGNGPPRRVVLVHPDDWYLTRSSILLSVAGQAGLGRASLLTKSVAVATHYGGRQLQFGHCLAILDLGGSSTVASWIGMTSQGLRAVGRPAVLPIGANNFDLSIEHFLMRSLAEMGRPLSSLDTRQRGELRRSVRKAREDLSTQASADLLLPDDSTFRITRGEVETLLGPLVTGCVRMLEEARRSASVSDDLLQGICLAGGGSRMPLVRRAIASQWPEHSVFADDPATVAARGAVIAAA